jgi:hypothetical protein
MYTDHKAKYSFPEIYMYAAMHDVKKETQQEHTVAQQ